MRLSLFEPRIDKLCLGQVNPEIVPNDRLGAERQWRTRELQAVMLKLLTMLLVACGAVCRSHSALPSCRPRAIAASIGEDIVVNGVAMRATHFQSPASTQDVLEFYRESWHSAIPAEQPREQSLGTWRVIGRQNGSRHETVQIRALPGGGTKAISPHPTPARDRARRHVHR